MSELTSFLADNYYLAAIFAPLAAIAVLLVERRIIKIYLLAFQYLNVSWLTVMTLPIESALAKLVAGLIASLVLIVGAERSNQGRPDQRSSVGLPRGRVFRVAAVALVVIGTIGVSFESWIPVEAVLHLPQRSATLLMVLAVLGISLYTDPMQVGISLLTLLSGFEIIYSAIEPALAVIALLALVHLGIALVVSYFEIVQSEVEDEVTSEA
ncbi:MAG: hypothetical protein PVH60_03435 [Anaerolineales bacterium]|jgi:hypothetical protein